MYIVIGNLLFIGEIIYKHSLSAILYAYCMVSQACRSIIIIMFVYIKSNHNLSLSYYLHSPSVPGWSYTSIANNNKQYKWSISVCLP